MENEDPIRLPERPYKGFVYLVKCKQFYKIGANGLSYPMMQLP